MTRKPLDWLDIGLHTGLALAWGTACGMGLALGLTYLIAPNVFDWWLGAAMAVFSLPAFLGGLLFWFCRERKQHEYDFGGRQSQWEWIAPSLANIAAFIIAGWWAL